ncbi:protein-export membrane protein SecD [Microgenomates group bacterium RIFCSPLOWO2_01_FULL_47_10]|nr:MAG: protein-export membrane protein SecD [Microgenomates group bacterium RIFCSPLOWO2_01_FULL_47_10]
MTLGKKLYSILFLTLFCAVIDMPKTVPLKLHYGFINIDTKLTRPEFSITFLGKTFSRDLEIKQGLDLKGGTQVLLSADMQNIDVADQADAIESSKEIISRRIDLYGVSEATVQSSVSDGEYRIIVELPGVSNIDQALDLIGQTAQLDFRELLPDKKATTQAMLSDFVQTELTGKNLKRSRVEFDPNNGQPTVTLEFDETGAKLFEEITARNVGYRVGIFLDQMPLMTPPNVSETIRDGKAIISGGFTTEEAKQISIQLNAGALPVPINIVKQQNIGATLGQESVQKSVRAGFIGLSMVMLFMILYYGWRGVIADVALIIYGLITLAIYKLLPVTLTLPGLAGFILSVGMAVDSNILIFERMKEEVRQGVGWQRAMELGFGRAWDAIKDANVATLITAFILFNPLNWNFLNSSGMIRGFALTLALGIIVSLFTGIVVTRTLLRAFYRPPKEIKQ